MFRRVMFFILSLMMIMTTCAFADVNPSDIKLDAPQNLAVEVKQHEDGKPYFQLKWNTPQGIKEIHDYWEEQGEAPLGYQIDTKIGNGKWYSEVEGDFLYGNNLHGGDRIIDDAPYDPISLGELDAIDIKANTYYFRIRYEFSYSDDDGDHRIFSPFSNIVSIGTEGLYKNASQWAIPELDKAAQYGFITDKIKDKMNGPITREEFCEIVVKLYEGLTGTVASYSSNPFSDTSNPEILKAYELGIVKGIGEGKFAPNNLVTRQEISVMLLRAIKLFDPEGNYDVSGVAKFKDEAEIASWAIDAVRFMFKNDIIKGSGDGTIGPKTNTTREQAVVLVFRTFEKYN